MAMQAIGLDRWPRFIADALERARDPATLAAIAESKRPAGPTKDAIRPVYPVESLLGIAAVGAVGGVAGAVRAVGGAILRQIVPEKSPEAIAQPQEASTAVGTPEPDLVTGSDANVRDKLSRYLLNPEHPTGQSKAKWFEQALGFTRQNSDEFARQIVFDETTAVQTAVTKYGIKFNQTVDIIGANGRVIQVNTAWIKGEDGVARLITAVPGK